MANIKARRKLADLYAIGVEVRFGPQGGRIGPFRDAQGQSVPLGDDEISLWVQPPSPLQREQAIRDASAARARAVLRAKRDEDSGEYLGQQAFFSGLTNETLIEYLVATGAQERHDEAQREVLARKEWDDVDALSDAMRIFQESGESHEGDPEYEALLEADRRFGEQVAEREDQLAEAERESYRSWNREALERKGSERRSELDGSRAFVTEYERQMRFYSVREADAHGVLFFESARELADADEQIQDVIAQALSTFIAEVGEAKKAPAESPGSVSSGQPSEPVTSAPSTPAESTE